MISFAVLLAFGGAEVPSPPWTAGTFVDTAYVFNPNLPDNHVFRGTNPNPRTGEFAVHVAALELTHPATKRNPWWIDIALHAGSGVDTLAGAEPSAGGPTASAGPQVFKHLARANAGLSFRSGTSVGAGLFGSPIGIGGFWSRDNWNYSPSWESNAAPFYLAGAQVRQTLPAGFFLEGWVVNGWQSNTDLNRAPSGLFVLGWARDDVSASQQVYFGPEQLSENPEYWRVHSDTQVVWDTRPLGAGIVFDIGAERPVGGDGTLDRWMGGAVFLKAMLFDSKRAQVFAAGRAGAWLDDDGVMFGVPQLLSELTATLTADLYSAIMPRLEYRFDASDTPFFYSGAAIEDGAPGLVRTQHTVTLALTGHYALGFGGRAR